MANPTQITAQIKFALSQMGNENAQHQFEHLCRQLCRKRICSNILPATGPVSAGGDQGRDFETFRTHLTSTFGESAFVGLTTSQRIVFACSLQKNNILGKIKTDIQSIVSCGTKVDEIHFFSTESIPVAKRHKLQVSAADGYGLHLEIYDLNAISELLSDRDTFWIATEYLSLSPELMPVMQDNSEANWYTKLKIKHSAQDEMLINYAEFLDLKSAIRFATFDEDYKMDISFWIAKLNQYILSKNQTLSRLAVYEVAVASLRGLETLKGIEFRLPGLFAQIEQLTGLPELENLAILNKYIIGAIARGICEINRSLVTKWYGELSQRIQDLLTREISGEYRAGLIGILANHVMLNENFEPRLEVERSLPWWQELIKLIPSLPLYPLETLSDHLNSLLGILGPDCKLEPIALAIDDLLATRFGKFKAGEKCRDRAILYYKKGLLLPAIEQAHMAKIKWFAHESRRGAALSMMFLADCYRELGLNYASKYYLYAAFKLVVQCDDNADIMALTTEILVSLSDAEALNGCYLNFLIIIEQYLKAYSMFRSNSLDMVIDDPNFQRMLANIAFGLVVCEKMNSSFSQSLKAHITKLGLDEILDELINTGRKTWSRYDEIEMKNLYVKQMNDRPFSDCGLNRIIRWSQSGLRFSIICDNDYCSAIVAEQIASTIQILLCDLARTDLCLLSGDVVLELTFSETANAFKIAPSPSNKRHCWQIEYPKNSTPKMPWEKGGSIRIIISLLMRLSVLPIIRVSEDLKKYFKGISSRLLIGNPYENLAEVVTGADYYNIPLRKLLRPLIEPEDFPLREHPDVAWQNGPAPGYGEQDTERMLQNRYNVSLSQIQITLKKLLLVQGFRKAVAKLRKEEWLDWHILGAIAAIRINHTVSTIMTAHGTDDFDFYIQTGDRIAAIPEDESSPSVPLELFTYENIKNQILLNTLSTIRGLGLQYRAETPNFESVLDFLKTRFGYLKDDIVHADPFVFE